MGLIDSAVLIFLAVLFWVLSGCVMPEGATVELDVAIFGAKTQITEQKAEDAGHEASLIEWESTDLGNAEPRVEAI
jgi:hypothetical protein